LNKENRYRRLPGRIRGFVRCHSTWIGEDHILLIGGTRFSETYQRVYFRDLQALLIRRKPRFTMEWPPLLLAPVLLFLVFGPLPIQRSFPFLAVVLAIVAIMAFLSIRFGCYLDLATAVGNVQAPAVKYLWTARRFAARVGPLAVASQQATPAI
jgi:hypothetical protein